MTTARCFVPLTLLVGAASLQVTPIEKVISLVSGLKSDVEAEGRAEAKMYEKFACFCKDTTAAKSESIKFGNDKIDELSADIGDLTQEKREDEVDLGERKARQEGLSTDLSSTVAHGAKEMAEYSANAADLSKAISSLRNGLESMEASKPNSGVLTLLQGSAHADLLQTLALADAMNMIATPKRKAVSSMLQSSANVDPKDPQYSFHSDEIMEVLESLHKDFTKEKKEADAEHEKEVKICDASKKNLQNEMSANSKAMKALDKNIQKFSEEIAESRESLVETNTQLSDDAEYLKDLTARCEARANDYDQRANMRDDEITAFSTALEVLKGGVKERADEVNKRALLLKVRVHVAPGKTSAKVTHSGTEIQKLAASKTEVVKKPVSLLQKLQVKTHSKSFLGATLTTEARKDKALALLMQEGQRLGSLTLVSLSQHSTADPFAKVKNLIGNLVERLVQEATAEATKKGFCDTELGKATQDRDFRHADTQSLSSDLEKLEAKRDALSEEMATLTVEMKEENAALAQATEERHEEKEMNMNTLQTAKEGQEALHEATLTLRSFYKMAAKAAFVQASPVTERAGFSGAYKGKQEGSKAVLDLLDTISSDFDRTMRTTEAAEKSAAEEFEAFSQSTKASISAKDMKMRLDTQDMQSTRTSLKTKMKDLTNAQDLLDNSLMEIEELKPTCIDTGMSYSERVQKREEEMEALKHAMCIMDTEGVEKDCQLG